MTPQQYKKLCAVTSTTLPPLTIKNLRNKSERTLLYGYTCARETFQKKAIAMNQNNLRLYNKIKDMPIAEALSYIKIMAENKSEKVVISFLIDCVILASDRRLIKDMIRVGVNDDRIDVSLNFAWCARHLFEIDLSDTNQSISFEDEEVEETRTFIQKLEHCVKWLIESESKHLHRDSILSAGILLNFAMEFGNSKRIRETAEQAVFLAQV